MLLSLRLSGVVPLLAFAAASAPAAASAQESVPAAERPMLAPRGVIPYFRALGSVLFGTGIRFNNPYRLATPLGDDAESLSRTAAYVDLGGAVLFGAPSLVQHGPSLRMAIAVEGIAQQVFSPGYVVCKQWRAVMPCARVAIPVVLAPSSNVGAEIGLGATYFVRSGIGLSVEGVGDLFYGASTRDTKYPAYPVLSLQGGLVVSYEVLP